MIKIVVKGLLVLSLMSIIFLFSSDSGEKSTKKSDYVITTIGKTFFSKQLSFLGEQEFIEKHVVFVRKTAHFVLYFLLTLSVISFGEEISLPWKKLFLGTLLFVFFYACSDEIHQSFVLGRSGSFKDVIVDTISGISSLMIYYFVRRKSHEQEKTTG